ncbi:MAG: winged helix-turn-helix transcriptional regulator [Candidatus Micrarchaeota archaeon]|nr:winged helix-turn-helix transcriptional regulator [Candidatus Micrarchaeota archaeon]MDE1804986.1 winged helix-turn-helix transcriptional regulator [Candidatus Micrarchaeota archaeon]MDE1846893.1 winged helix-turn-helix transcriptional regulator [Candidatus Micrarchaeota archaeon]
MGENDGALLLKEKQARIILALTDKGQEWYLTSLAQAAKATYVHTSRFVARCEALGLIQVVKHGKIKTLSLTEKGSEVAKGIASIMERTVAKVEEPAAPQEKKA